MNELQNVLNKTNECYITIQDAIDKINECITIVQELQEIFENILGVNKEKKIWKYSIYIEDKIKCGSILSEDKEFVEKWLKYKYRSATRIDIEEFKSIRTLIKELF